MPLLSTLGIGNIILEYCGGYLGTINVNVYNVLVLKCLVLCHECAAGEFSDSVLLAQYLSKISSCGPPRVRETFPGTTKRPITKTLN
jgi:hypothetical protein